MRNTVVNVLDAVPVTIASGQSLSGPINLGGLRLFGIVMPATWTAANLTFQMSADNGVTWNNLYDSSGAEIVVTAGTSRCIVFDPTNYSALQWIQVRSGTSATPVAQGANATMTLVLRSV